MKRRIASGLAPSQPRRQDVADGGNSYTLFSLRGSRGVGSGEREVHPVSRNALGSVRKMLLLAACISFAWGCGQNSTPVTTSHEENARGSVPQSPALAPRHDLEHDEAQGGHTLRKHVGQTDAQL